MKGIIKGLPEYSKTTKSYENNIDIMNAIAALKK